MAKAGPEAPVTVARPTPQVLPSGGAIGTLVLTDTTTGIKRNLDVTVLESNADKTVYSSGDVIARDGKVLQVRVGDAALSLVSGALWTIPLEAGTSGEAGIKRVDVGYESAGTLTWKAVAGREGRVQIDADVAYRVGGNGAFVVNPYGKWLAAYSDGHPLPETSAATIGISSAGGANMVSSQLKLFATSPHDSPPGATTFPSQAPLAQPAIGTLVLTDTLTGIKRSLDVTVLESNAEKTVYSSGDVVAKDGSVLQVRIGDAVLRLLSGALWTIPLKAGTTGEAGIKRVDGDYESTGTLSWKTVAAGDAKARIEADVTYTIQHSSRMVYNLYGKWLATYRGGQPLPESSAATMRRGAGEGSNMIAAELKLR